MGRSTMRTFGQIRPLIRFVTDNDEPGGGGGDGDENDIDEDEPDDEDDDEGDEDEDDDDDLLDDDDEDDAGKGKGLDEAALMQKVESRIDKRLNVILREIRGNGRGRQQNRGQQRNSSRRDDADVRGARLAYRDYVADEIKFTSAEEREMANYLARNAIEARARAGFDDEDEVGREVAKEVAERITGLRRQYVRQTKAGLRRRGMLAETKSGQGSGEGRGRQAGVRSEFSKGKSLAEERHGKRK